MPITGNFIEYGQCKLNIPFQAKVCKCLHNIVLYQVYKFHFIQERGKFQCPVFMKKVKIIIKIKLGKHIR